MTSRYSFTLTSTSLKDFPLKRERVKENSAFCNNITAPGLPNLKNILMCKWQLIKNNHCLEKHYLTLSHIKMENLKEVYL